MRTRPGLNAAIVLTVSVIGLGACTGLVVERPARSRSADPAARPGGSVGVGIQRPASLDPAGLNDRSGALIASLICEPLIQIDPNTGELASGLVESVVTARKGTSFTLRLRSGVRFHNGQRLTAQDVVYSLSRVARHDVASPSALLLRSVLGFETIHAPLPPTESGDPTKRTLSGVRAISSNAVEVGLSEPNAEFLRVLSLPFAAPVPRRLPDEDASFAGNPVCVGPYMMSGPLKAGAPAIELKRDPDYYGANLAFTQGGRGYADVIRFHIKPNLEEELKAFETEEVDIAHVPPTRLAGMRTQPHLKTASTPSIEFLGVPSSAPFDSKEARAVLSRAIDRTGLVSVVYAGGRVAADRFLPPSLSSSQAPVSCGQNVPSSGSDVAIDPELLAEIRRGSYQLAINPDFANRALADGVVAQWREKLGIDVKIVEIPWSDYLAKVTSPQGIDSMFRESWSPQFPSADAVVHPLFHSSQIGTNNWARFNDQTFDRRLVRVARRESSDELRTEKYGSLEEILCRELPLIPLTFGQEEYLLRTPKLAAATESFFDKVSGSPLLREIYVRRT